MKKSFTSHPQPSLFPTPKRKADIPPPAPVAVQQPKKTDNLIGMDGFPWLKPRYTWADAPGWWNPLGEEIMEDHGELVKLAYSGKFIAKQDLIRVDILKVAQDKAFNVIYIGKVTKLADLLADEHNF
jgi:hypothetical protein